MKIVRITVLLAALLSAFNAQAGSGGNGCTESPYPSSHFEALNYGLHWYNSGREHQQWQPGETNDYYNPQAPTVIYVHGWTVGGTSDSFKESFDWGGCAGWPQVDVIAHWKTMGWNVGLFHWNQFADEFWVTDAEAKIWTANGDKGMRWRDINDHYRDSQLNKSANDLFVEQLVSALNPNNESELRIVGHSLGSQMAIRASYRLLKGAQEQHWSTNLVPHRVAILDPFFSTGWKGYLNWSTVGEQIRVRGEALISAGVAMEVYRTSFNSSNGVVSDPNTALLNQLAFAEVKPWYFNAFNFQDKHISAFWHYFWSYSHDTPDILWSWDQGLSASTPTHRVKQLMRSPNKLVHSWGNWSKTPADDVFEYKKK